MSSNARRQIRADTMACWWPSRMNNLTSPRWDRIAAELHGHLLAARSRLEPSAMHECEQLEYLLRIAQSEDVSA